MNTAATRPGWVPDHLYPFESNYLEIDGCRVHYVDEGAGPILLFLHGAPTWSFLYRNIILGLRDSYRCIALDYPGCGLSSARPSYNFTAAEHADIVQRFVSDLDLRDATLMGHDWGGPIGLTVATRESDRFSGLILSNTWAWPLNGILHFELFGRVMGSPFMKLWIRHRNAFVTFMLPMATATRLSEEVMNAYRGPFPTPDRRRPSWEFPRELLRSKPFMQQLERNLPKIQQLPTLLLWGGADFALRKNHELPRFQKLFPNNETVILEGAKHFFQEDAPVAAAKAIRRWLSERQIRQGRDGRAQ